MDPYETTVATIKFLAMDAIQKANSGHPGMPVGTAGLATVLWSRFLKHDPADPRWPDRDRFVLSAGHGSMLLYSLLHLSGYDLSLDDLRQFRQWGSRTPGHPEYGHTPGVETTTGPLGQGVANAVGMALAERVLREHFGPELVDHRTWVLAGDGCLMEGISNEAASLAGHLGLDRLTLLWDDNRITIDGSTELSFTEDVKGRFAALGWQVLEVDGHDPEAVAAALEAAQAETARPSFIDCHTHIAEGTLKQDSNKAHGSPLGPEVIADAKRRLGWDPEARFRVPPGARATLRAHDGPARRAAWEARLEAHPRKDELLRWLSGDGVAIGEAVSWPRFEVGATLATRKSSAACLKAIVEAAPQVFGGSADLAGSNGTNIGVSPVSREEFAGHAQVAWGIREHAMASMANGIALHGGLIPYTATFLVFHDYMRPAVRLAALMGQRVIHIYTHDSIFLGEDGPTHQPVETLLALRTIPGARVLRPADAKETVAAWKLALERADGPTALVLSRQGLPTLEGTSEEGVRRGGYVVADGEGCDVILVATGSEVHLAMQARELLAEREISARVVSMPCRECFLEQGRAYQSAVLTPGCPRVSIEAGVTLGWERWVGEFGLCIGIDDFGASAPPADLAHHYGLTPEKIAERVQVFLAEE